MTSAAAGVSRRRIWVDLLLYPTHTLPTAAAPVLVGIGLAVHDGVFALVPAFLGFLASWLIHVGGVLADNYALLTRHPDVREHPELSDALESGALSRRTLAGAAIGCFVLAAAVGPYLLDAAGFAVVAFGAVGVLASWSYAAGPFAYARRGFADPIFFVMFGVVAVAGTYYVQAAPAHIDASNWYFVAGALPADALLAGLSLGALIVNVMLIDDMRDHAYDAAKGWRTGTVRFGLGWTRGEIALLTVFAYLMPFALWLWRGFSPWAAALPFLTLPLAVSVVRTVRRTSRYDDLFPMSPRASMLALLFGALLAAGLAL